MTAPAQPSRLLAPEAQNLPPTPPYVQSAITDKSQFQDHVRAPEVGLIVSESLTQVIQALFEGVSRNASRAASAQSSREDEYDPVTRGWLGEQGLRYRVPLMTVPSSTHCRYKQRNIQILLNNVRELCVSDHLPCTQDEKHFWTSYRFLRYQLFLVPFCSCVTVTYTAAKLLFHRLPHQVRGRSFPIAFSLAFAEQWAEHTFPAHDLLESAMQARTPLGDAARAEWLRLQPISIPASRWLYYKYRRFIREPIEGFEFSGDAVEATR